jgi:hypothetical protein
MNILIFISFMLALPSAEAARPISNQNQIHRIRRETAFYRQASKRIRSHQLNYDLFKVRSKLTQLRMRRNSLDLRRPADQMELSRIDIELVSLKQQEHKLRAERAQSVKISF